MVCDNMNRRDLLQRGMTTAALGTTLTTGCISVNWNPDEGESSNEEDSDQQGTGTPESPSVDGQWPMARFDPTNSGATGEEGPQTEPSVTTLFDTREKQFRLDLNRPGTYVTAAGEYIYIKGESTGLSIFSTTTGEEVIRDPSSTPDLSMGYSTPIVINDMVVFADSTVGTNAHLGVANAVTGEPIWRHEFDGDDVTPHSACADQNSIYLFTRQGDVYAFSHNGDLLWEVSLKSTSRGKKCGFQSDPIHSPILATDKYLIISGTDSAVYLINKINQKVSELIDSKGCSDFNTQFSDTKYRYQSGGTAFADGHVFIARSGSQAPLAKINAETEDIAWTQELDFNSATSLNPVLGPVVDDNSVYVYSPAEHCDLNCDDNFFAISKMTGEKQWGNRIPGASYLPVVSNDVIYIASSSWDETDEFGDLDLVTALSTDTGRELWSVKINGLIDSNLVLSDGKLFVFTRRPNNIYTLS